MSLRINVLVSLFLLPIGLKAACHDPLPVGLRVVDHAGVPPDLLTTAVHEAVWLLTSLCVDLLAHPDKVDRELEIHILKAPLTAGMDTNSLGLAMPAIQGGNHGAVFLSRLQQVVADYPDVIDVPTLLGDVLAHEIGHLLLRTKSHSNGGIMQANFGEAQLRMASQRKLVFSPTDRRTVLRSTLRTGVSAPPRHAGE